MIVTVNVCFFHDSSFVPNEKITSQRNDVSFSVVVFASYLF
jgi:hypothetical protein